MQCGCGIEFRRERNQMKYTPEEYAKKAGELFHEGYNCAQAVIAVFAEEVGLDMDTAMKFGASFGGGLGKMREVCGAVSGMAMAAGMKYGAYEIGDNARKKEHYALIQELARRFKEKNGTIICRELLHLDKGIYEATPEVRSTEYYKKRPCREMVEDAAYIFAQYVQEQETAEA